MRWHFLTGSVPVGGCLLLSSRAMRPVTGRLPEQPGVLMEVYDINCSASQQESPWKLTSCHGLTSLTRLNTCVTTMKASASVGSFRRTPADQGGFQNKHALNVS